MRNIFITTILLLTIMTTAPVQAQDNSDTRTKVEITTSFGTMTLELYNETPIHRDNFIKLVKEGFFNESEFHRIIKGFMIQGGGLNGGMSDAGYTLEAEIVPGMMHKRGAFAAARKGDAMNPEKRSSGSQFYIVDGRTYSPQELEMLEKRMDKPFTAEQKEIYSTVGGAPHLDGEYTIFGELIDGFDVMDKIAAVKTSSRGNKPLETINMTVKIVD